MARKSGLGKGLDALFQDNGTKSGNNTTLRLSEVEPNKNQPRKHFDDEALASLADSIREHGVLQPLLVRPLPNSKYQIIAGERRWRACRMLGLSEVPVIIKEMEDVTAAEIALIENLQREDLSPLEEAEGYQELIDIYGLTQEQVSQRVGKSRSAVANSLRILQLPKGVLDLVAEGSLSAGQARTILSFPEEEQEEIALLVKKKGLTVRELEKMSSQKKKRDKAVKIKEPFSEDSFYKELEISMREELNRKISIDITSGEQGCLKIDFYSKDELVDIAYRLAGIKE